MANVTVSIDDDLKDRMNQHPEINWSEVARQAIQQKIKDFEIMEEIASKSKLTEKDVEELSNKINKDVSKEIKN